MTATNGVGEGPDSNEASATPATPPAVVTFTSVASQDGWVLESTEAANAGGSLAATATTTTTSALRVGDDSGDRQYKAVVSFDTSSLPDGATIVAATLRLRRGTLSGTSPFTTHGTCWADVQAGTGFAGSTTLQTGDFQAAAAVVQAASLGNAASNGSWSEGSLFAAGLAALNKTGRRSCASTSASTTTTMPATTTSLLLRRQHDRGEPAAARGELSVGSSPP